MHVYKHLNINSKSMPLELRRGMTKRKENISIKMIVFGHTVRLHAHGIPDDVLISMHQHIISSGIYIDSLVYMDEPNVPSVDINNMSTSIFRLVITITAIRNETWC